MSYLFNNTRILSNFSAHLQASNETSAIDQWKVVQNVYYILIGLFIILADGAVWTTIVCVRRHRAHSELPIVAALMFAETACGLAYFAGGVWRLFAALDPQRPEISAIDCMKTFHVSFFILAPQLLTLMTLVVSIDRLVCVLWVRRYGQMSACYTRLMLGVPLCLTAASYAWAWQSSLASPRASTTVDPACMISTSVTRRYYWCYSILQVVAAGASVAIYIVVICIFTRKPAAPGAVHPTANQSIQARQLKRQRKMTKTLAMMSLLYFVTYLLPQTGLMLLGTEVYTGSQSQRNAIIVWIRIVMAFYSACNVVIYLMRRSEVTVHIWILFNRYMRRKQVVVPT